MCTGMTASVVIGQTSMTANSVNEGDAGSAASQTSLYWPYTIAFDSLESLGG